MGNPAVLNNNRRSSSVGAPETLFRLTWAASEEAPGTYRGEPYANLGSREEAFTWGSLLLRLGAKDVRVTSAPKARVVRRQELFRFLMDAYCLRHPRFKLLELTGEAELACIRSLAQELKVPVEGLLP